MFHFRTIAGALFLLFPVYTQLIATRNRAQSWHYFAYKRMATDR